MYQLISAIAKALTNGDRWVNLDISNIPLSTLFSTYSDIIVTLSNPFLSANVSLDLSLIRSGIAGETITFDQFLVQNGNNTLPTSNMLPVINPKYAEYADAFHAGYKIAPIGTTASLTTPLPVGDKPNLFMTRNETDYNLFYQSCLVNVNGFYHLTDTDGTGIYVVGGNKSRLISKQNQIGITSFRKLGTLSFIPITPAMVYKQNNRQSFLNNCYVNLGVDVSNKTVMLSLGGYLHVLDPVTFYQTGPQTFGINFSNLPLLDRYYESKRYLDFSSLPLSKTSRNRNQIAISEFFSDANLLAYLTLSQSFFIVLDNPNVFVNKSPIHKTKLTDMFISYVPPTKPLIVGAGKVANYWYTYEDKQYSINCHDSLRYNAIYNTVNASQQNSVSDARVVTNPSSQSLAMFLEIGVDF